MRISDRYTISIAICCYITGLLISQCALAQTHIDPAVQLTRIEPTKNDQLFIQSAIDKSTDGRLFLLPGTYHLGRTGLKLRNGFALECSSPANTILSYDGSESALLFESVSYASVKNCQIRLTGSSAARGIEFTNRAGDTKWNSVFNVLVNNQSSATPIRGQVGLQMLTSTRSAMYWNFVEMFQGINLDTAIRLSNTSSFTANGSNDNTFMVISVHHCNVGMELSQYATENRVFGLSGSASGLLGPNTLLVIGDGSSPADFNMIYGLVSDQGRFGQAWRIQRGVSNTLISGTDQSGVGPEDRGISTLVMRIGGGVSSVTVPDVRVQNDSSIVGLRHVRDAFVCNTPPTIGGHCSSSEIPWSRPFSDDKYTASCTLSAISGQPHIVGTQQTPAGLIVTIATEQPRMSSARVSCIGVHD